MPGSAQFFISVWLKFFFLFTPFFALSMFLSMTRHNTRAERRRIALATSGAAGVFCIVLFFFGETIFSLLGITLDAFRVGAGALLFLSAVGLVQSRESEGEAERSGEDIAVVPLAMPIIVGPATIGTLLVLGAEISGMSRKGLGCLALLLAVVTVATILWLAPEVERLMGKRGIRILGKISGVVLAALAAQMMLTGIRDFMIK